MSLKGIGLAGLFEKRKVSRTKHVPLHIAIIPDGNGRWAVKRGMPRSAGHRVGANTLKKIVKYCNEIGVKYLTAYVFSTENWKRPKSEIDTLMGMLLEYLQNAERELSGSNIRIRVIGDRAALSEELQREITRVEKLTEKNTGLCLVFAVNYGSHDELTQAAKNLALDVKKGRLSVDDINKEVFRKYLFTSDIPDPDLVIRTSGEMRTSNFLLWQTAYSEFWFTKVLWPDFSERHMKEAIEDFSKRNRRFGGL